MKINLARCECIGKAEPLVGNLSGFWRLIIAHKNRIVEDTIEIAECSSHYKEHEK